jgi:hypothetical protein
MQKSSEEREMKQAFGVQKWSMRERASVMVDLTSSRKNNGYL